MIDGRRDRAVQAYFESAYSILAEDGYAGLKLAPLCERVGVTTGAFYHNFRNWRDFTQRFLDNWHSERTTRLIDIVGAEQDSRTRLTMLLETAAQLPHRAEAAIRVWSTMDREAAIVQRSVDLERMHIVKQTFRSLSLTEEEAHNRAVAALYLVIGHELAGAARDDQAFAWSLTALIDSSSTSQTV